jgi:hypothetical protein
MISFNKFLLAFGAGLGSLYGQNAATNIKPLVSDLYTADPSAHVFNGKIYIYPSHDVEAEVPQDDEGGHFQMRDYHVYSMDKIGGKVTDHGVALDVKDVPWLLMPLIKTVLIISTFLPKTKKEFFALELPRVSRQQVRSRLRKNRSREVIA